MNTILKKLALPMVVFASVFFMGAAAHAEGEPAFDGKAYFVWECNNGRACYHLFENLKRPEDGINYIEDTSITDQSGNGVNYVFKQPNADWVLPSDFNSITSESFEDYIGNVDKDTHGVSIMAIAFGGGNNSIATNEDWLFQVVIYRSGYTPVVVGDNPDDYTYFPARWGFNYNYNIDVSDTTASSPAVVEAYLKEPIIKLKVDDIVSVKALDVNPAAVTITPTLDGYDLAFNSSYYDHITFELKSATSKSYYLMVARTAIDVHDDITPDMADEDIKLITRVMYPTGTADENTYSVVATVVSSEGTQKVYTLSAEDIIETYYDFQEDKWVTINHGKTMECGKNLTCSEFSVKTGGRNYQGVFLNVVKTGSSATRYSGTFSGSGEGNFFDSKTRKVIYE